MTVIVKRAILGGGISAVIMGVGTFILGEVSGYEAKALLSSSLSGVNMLCNTIILGSSTILALMLTLISLSRSAESRLSKAHYAHVLIVARTITVLIIATVITFLLLNLPITESEQLPPSWFSTIYYVSLGMAAVLGGAFVTVITLLYGTIENVIQIIGFKRTDHPLVEKDDEEENLSKQERNSSVEQGVTNN